VVAAGTALAGVRVAGAPGDAEWLEAARAEVPATYPRLDRRLPAIELVDQRGEAFTWERIAGRPALLTFGFGHCETVCPMTVMNARRVRDRFRAEGREMALVVITLDPWRDTPSRLPALARQFHLGGDGPRANGEEGGKDAGSFLLSGTVDEVNAALDALQVARERVPNTGDIVHPALVYLLDGEGTVVYAASGHADLIEELARRM
jgi:cytochrome oxidase Cu insertion factor (SCO1/SenC/PrrC family)